jgi:CHAD domain-containing protein
MATAGPAAGLADPRTAGPAPFGAPALDDDVVHRTSARDVIRASIVRSVEILLLDLPAARLGDDPEGVHQARVATRRLRSDLRTFQPMLDDGWVRSLRSELRRLADALGAVRDTDVLVVRLGRTLDELSDVDPAAGSRLVDALERERDEHRGRLRALLDEPDTIALYDHLVAAAADPRTIGRALGRADHRLAPLVRRPWRNLERAVEALDDDPSVDDLHRVRLLAKRVRYAAEAVAPAIGRPAERFAADVTRIQDVLGELNDDRVMADWLTGIAPHLDPPAAFVAGRAAQLTNDRAAVRRDEWVDAYRRAARPRRRAWFG